MISVGYDHQIFAGQHVGGISRYLCELAKRVAHHGEFRAHIVAPLHFNSYLREAEIAVLGTYVPPIRRTGTIVRAINNAVSPSLFRFLRPQVMHETYYQPHSLVSSGTPTVITVYDMIHERFPKHFRASDPLSAHKRAAVERAHRIICISENTRRDLIELFGVQPEKTSVIHLGFGLTASNSSHVAVATTRQFILYVGHRGSWKNWTGLLAAYASSQHIRKDFLLLAFGGGKFSSAEVERIRGLGLTGDEVKQVSGNDRVLASLYRSAALFVYPSLYEGFGIPLLEAMSFGCAVSCSNASSIPEVAGDAVQYFDPNDPASIACAIESVLSSPELKRKLVARGHDRISHFSWDECATQTMQVYRELVQ